LIWDKIIIIWDPDDIVHLKDYAVRTPVLLDRGLVKLAKPHDDDVTRASKKIEDLSHASTAQVPTDNEFASTFALHPVKVTGAYWDHARRSADGFVHVPPHLGTLYVGLLSQEMAIRAGIPTISMRYEEPLFLAGAASPLISSLTAENCVARAALEVLEIELKEDGHSSDSDLVERACDDITALRNLDGWHAWRELICEYLNALESAKPYGNTIATISADMQSALRRYEAEASRQKLATIWKIGVTVAAGAVGFFVGAVPGAIAGAASGSAMLGIDLYQRRNQIRVRRSGWQHFVLMTRKRFS
jgi:hypothetical protein